VNTVTSNADRKKDIDSYILEISRKRLADIARSDGSPESIREHTEVVNFLRELMQLRREINSIGSGSVIFSVMCPTLEALDDLHVLCYSGKLTQMAIDAYLTDDQSEDTTLTVTVDETEWTRCRALLLSVGEYLKW